MSAGLAPIDRSAALDLLTRLVATPSQCGIDDEQAIAELIAEELSAAGVDVELREVAPGRPNVVARLAGAGTGPALMFNGHLDTTPQDSAWTRGHDVEVTDDGVVVGHGARNMKGGLTSIILALQTWGRSGERPPGDVHFTGVMGHHEGGVGTRALLRELDWPAHTVIPEPTDLGVRTVQTGSLALRVDVVGRTAPAGNAGMLGRYATPADAAIDPVRVVDDLVSALDEVPWRVALDPRLPDLPMAHVRRIEAGYGPGMLGMAFAPDRLRATVGVFTLAGQTAEEVRGTVESHLAARLTPRGFSVEVGLIGHARDLLDVPLDAPITHAVTAAHRAVTRAEPESGVLLPHSYFGCDAQVLAGAGLDAISYGPASHAYRYENRGRVRLDDVVTCAETFVRLPLALAEAASA